MISLRKSVGANALPPKQDSRTPQSDAASNNATQSPLDYATVQGYLNMTQEERWALLVEKFSKAKQDGTMTAQDLERMVASARAVLAPDQYERLRAMVDRLNP